VHPIAQRDSAGECFGLPAIRAISQSLFKAFGMSNWLKHERDKAAKRQRKAARPVEEQAMGRMELMLKAAEAKQGSAAPPPQEPAAPSNPGTASARTYLQAAIALLRGKNRGPP
jgi:hypothetical protein